jgi:ornithine decarboxylase
MEPQAASEWMSRVTAAMSLAPTPMYVSAWTPVERALRRVSALDSSVPIRSWLSLKTHPLPALAKRWLRSGRGIEVVSERELTTARQCGASADDLLVNGPAKHAWLRRSPIPRLRVHFDSWTEMRALLPMALEYRWRVGVRCHVPDERDARVPAFGGPFGMDHDEAVVALRELQECGADVQGVHFHLGQSRRHPRACERAVRYVAAICADAAVQPSVLDVGGGLPAPDDPSHAEAWRDLSTALAAAPRQFERLAEIWLENGRHVLQESTALVVRVLDVKDRPECRYVICDGGRTNQALAADHGRHAVVLLPPRGGDLRLTTVCGPTCMTDDVLGRWDLPTSLRAGDSLCWLGAGAYHLPWETRFSQGLCAIVWCDDDERARLVRPREALEGAVEPVHV